MLLGSQPIRVVLQRILIVLLAAVCQDTYAQAPTPPAAAQAIMPTPVAQQNGDFIMMPQNLPASRRSGLLLAVDTRWVNAYGYRPVEVTISSPLPTTSAHTIAIQLHSGWNNVTTVEQEFEIPAGATRASTTVSVPFYEQAVLGYWWDVRVDGVKDIDLSIDKEDASRRASGSNVSASTVRVLVPGTQANYKSVVTTPVFDFEVLSLPLGEFPRRWIDYTCLDVVSLSTVNLEQLAKTQPAVLESIERWVRTGGQLWVCDVGDELEKLPAISQQLGVPKTLEQASADLGDKDPNTKAIETGGEQSGDRPADVAWRPGRFRGGGPPGQPQGSPDARGGRYRRFNDSRGFAPLERDPNFARTNDLEGADDPNVERRWPSDSRQWYVEQRHGLGTLRAFRGANQAAVFSLTAPASNANALANANQDAGQLPRSLAMALRSTRHWDARHGLIPDTNSPEFAKLLVPAVGRAPVTEFEVLITLFVLLIGPFNYWILKRYKRLQLLVLTVPLAAGVSTAALFAYAIMSDGFATTARVRSYTTIDQQTGEAACWARSSYYAGIAPAKGLTISADVVVYPMLPIWGGDGWGTNRAMTWDDDRELLTQGWLNSRTPTQYLMVRSRKTPHRLEVTAGNGKMQIVNRLGTPIESLLVLDDEGTFFSGEAVASDARMALAPISRDDAAKRIVQLVRDNEPELPPELAGSDRDFGGRQGRSIRRLTGRYRPASGDSQASESQANRAISDLAGMNGRPALDVPVRTYVAVTTTGPEVETGIPYATEQKSFHVVVGRW